MYEFKISLFDNGKLESFLFLILNIKMTLEASVMFADNVKLHYLSTLLRGESLCEFDNFCIQIRILVVIHLNQLVLGLST